MSDSRNLDPIDQIKKRSKTLNKLNLDPLYESHMGTSSKKISFSQRKKDREEANKEYLSFRNE